MRRPLRHRGQTISSDAGDDQRQGLTARSFLQLIGVAVLLALLLKVVVLDACRIPTASMENTILAGDFLLVNKIAYGAQTPSTFPFTRIAIPSFRLPGLVNPRRGDVIVFQYPGDPGQPNHDGSAHFVKRCIALPGDTVAIADGRLQVNRTEVPPPRSARPGQTSIPAAYGPVVVPKKGDLIDVSGPFADQWRVLAGREGHTLGHNESGEILVDGVRSSVYRVARNYYFVLGDNRGDSFDSRSWGFLPDDHIVGKAMMVYWSWDERQADESFLTRLLSVRWERLGTMIY